MTQRRTEGKVNVLGGESTCCCQKKVNTNISLIMNAYREGDVFESPNSTPLDFCLRGSMKNEVYKRKVDTSDEMLARVLDDAARKKKKKSETQLRPTTRDLRTQAAKCTDADDGIFENLL